MEILQGARDQKSFDRLRNYFSSQQFFRTQDPEKTYSGAASIYLNCRKSGVTVRSVVDCLIAQYAMEQDLILLHHDRDFAQIASVFPKLKQRNFLD
jgi:predicted nucleic acid-binding protein